MGRGRREDRYVCVGAPDDCRVYCFNGDLRLPVALFPRVRRGKLRREWQEGAQEQTLEEFLDEGLEEYDNSPRRKMILSVYVIPVILVSLVIYLTNFA